MGPLSLLKLILRAPKYPKAVDLFETLTDAIENGIPILIVVYADGTLEMVFPRRMIRGGLVEWVDKHGYKRVTALTHMYKDGPLTYAIVTPEVADSLSYSDLMVANIFDDGVREYLKESLTKKLEFLLENDDLDEEMRKHVTAALEAVEKNDFANAKYVLEQAGLLEKLINERYAPAIFLSAIDSWIRHADVDNTMRGAVEHIVNLGFYGRELALFMAPPAKPFLRLLLLLVVLGLVIFIVVPLIMQGVPALMRFFAGGPGGGGVIRP